MEDEKPLVQLLEYSTKKLLEEFGRGNHKPGSGSAAAFQGMLSAQLIRTVISLTNKEKRRAQYKQWLPELLKMNSEIANRIYPALERLFQEDSIQFDKAITLRKRRDQETDPTLKAELAAQALNELIPSTELPLEIAQLCYELGDIAAFVFDHGFTAVRGDSAVALNGAASGVAGCLSIIELNLLSFKWDEWTREIRSETSELKSGYKKLLKKSTECLEALEAENQTKRGKQFERMLVEFQSGRWEDVQLTEAAIESLAKKLQNSLWDYREFFWQDDVPGTHIDVLKPDVAIEKILGYRFGYAQLGRYTSDDGDFEVAGQIDKQQKVILVSRRMRQSVQNFTAAHELAHALLHKEMILHRDRPLDGSVTNKDIKERQADKFASYFLMPEKQMRAVFSALFAMETFVINANTVFSLGEGRVSAFRKKVKDINGLARYIAGVEHFQGRTFRSLSDIFNVSIGAMGIRLKELDLVRY